MKAAVVRLFLSTFVLLVSSIAFAYDPPPIPITSAPLGSFTSGTFDTVNLANLDVHFEIPVLQKAGKGQPFSYNLAFNSLVWVPVARPGDSQNPYGWKPMKTWGWPTLRTAAMGYVARASTGGGNYTNFVYFEPNGGGHSFFGANCGGSCGSFQYPILANDNSGFRITAYYPNTGLATIVNRSGIVLNVPAVDPFDGGYSYGGTLVDPNGNTITAAQHNYTDTTGAQVLTLSSSGGLGDDDAGSPLTLTYTAPSQAPATVRVTFLPHTIQTNFQVCYTDQFHERFCVYEYPDRYHGDPVTHYLVDKVTMPDGTYYQLGYEQTDGYPTGTTTGRITSVRLPTGGSITYSYTGTTCYDNNNCMLFDGSPSSMSRTLGGQTWHYTHDYQPSFTRWGLPLQSTASVTDPLGNETDLNFSQGFGPPDQDVPYETVRTVYKGPASQGHVLDYVYTCYNNNYTDSTCPTAVVNAESGITRTARIDHLNRISFTSLASNVQQLFDQSGNVTEEDDYDFGSPGSQPLLRKSTFAFNGPLCASPLYICDRTATAIVKDSHGAQAGRMDYVYDGGANTKGNVTQTTQWVGASSSSLVRQYSYNTGTGQGGTLASATDWNGAVTSVAYDANVCGGAFPISVTEPGGLATTYGYNCTGGMLTSTTDPNSGTVSTTYSDLYFWRPAGTVDALGNTTSYNYYGVTNFPAGSTMGIGQVEAGMIWNNGNSATDTVTTHDALGRLLLTQTRQAPRGQTHGDSFDTVETDYDGLGNVSQVSQPFACALGQGLSQCSAPVTRTTYDALNRPVLTTNPAGGTTTYTYSLNDVQITVAGGQSFSKQIEKDALGRIGSVCEMSTSLQGVGDCGQQTHQTGYPTVYQHDALGDLTGVTQGTETRSYQYDGVSRLVQETNPESVTTGYDYDSDPTGACPGNFPGDKVRRTDVLNNDTCYGWDGLHRLTAATYKGPNAANTQNKYYSYDISRPGQGITATNSLGRLVYAFAYAASGSGWGDIVSVNSGKCADVVNVSQADGALVQQWDCLGSNQYNQRWVLNPVGTNLYQIISENSGKCLDVRDVSRQDGAAIQQYDCLGPSQTNQIWSLVPLAGAYQVVSENSGKCLDVTGVSKSDGALLQQFTCLGSGQLNQLWTLTTSPGPAINWSAFAYDKRGAATDFYEVSAFGYGPYHTVNTLAPNGTVATRAGYLWDAVNGRNNGPFANVLGYSFDGEGRPNGLTDQTTGEEIWAHSAYHTTYNPAGQPDQLVFLPSVDKEAFTWDQNTGQMTNWESVLSSGAEAQYGTLTWSPNGTLSRLQIQDQANGANNQTCNYTYDDLGRLGSVDCGPSVWKQIFSYDQWGNITKTVPQGSQGTSFPATYNVFTNRFENLVNEGLVTYDGNGDITLDSQGNRFTYDAEGRAVHVNTSATVFDAFNRPIAIQKPTSFNQIVYGPDGYKFAIMNGQSVVKYTAPLAVGVQAVYTANSPARVAYWRHSDWIGSSRLASTRASAVYYGGAYAPFGENYAETGTWDRSFTGQEQSTIYGLYDFPLRQQAAVEGRWLVPDPGGLVAADPASPQTWNRYAYAQNNPVVNKDSLGLCDDDDCDDGGDDFFDFPGYWYFPPVYDVNLIFSGSNTAGDSGLSISSDHNGLYGGFPNLLAYYTFGPPSAGTWAASSFVANTFAVATIGVVGGVFVGAEAGSLSLYGPAANRIFWTGGRILAGQQAMQRAMSSEGTTLEMTPVGRALEFLGDWAPSSWWDSAAAKFAEGAEGPVTFVEGPYVRLGNTWMKSEFPALSGKGNPIHYVPVGWPGWQGPR